MIETPADDWPKDAEFNGFVKSAGKWWQENPGAENATNLVSGYYSQLVGGKTLDWIRCYAKAEYNYVQEGKPITPEYDDESRSVDTLEDDKALPIQNGLDIGQTPAACSAELSIRGE